MALSTADKRRNNHRPPTEKDLEHLFYDLSIDNLEDRKAKAQLFKNAKEVAAFLGEGKSVKYVAAHRGVGEKAEATDGKLYAIRVVKKG